MSTIIGQSLQCNFIYHSMQASIDSTLIKDAPNFTSVKKYSLKTQSEVKMPWQCSKAIKQEYIRDNQHIRIV